MPESRTLLLATTNLAKVERLRWALDGLGFTLLTLRDLPQLPPVEETESSYEGNAVLKAATASAAWGGLAVATDGGVTIPALGERWNGLFTARAAGPQADDEARVRHLLHLMEGKTGEERRIFWTEALALADRGRFLASWSVAGNDQGVLAESFTPEQVVPGFWVTTIWYYPQLGRRYPELTDEERVRLDTPWTELRERLQAYLRDWASGSGDSSALPYYQV